MDSFNTYGRLQLGENSGNKKRWNSYINEQHQDFLNKQHKDIPESKMPFSPTTVSYPCGKSLIKLSALAISATF